MALRSDHLSVRAMDTLQIAVRRILDDELRRELVFRQARFDRTQTSQTRLVGNVLFQVVVVFSHRFLSRW
jgi:hypothetical protein